MYVYLNVIIICCLSSFRSSFIVYRYYNIYALLYCLFFFVFLFYYVYLRASAIAY